MIIGNYTFKKKLGEGGMATVYLAEHNTLNQPVAVKLLNKEFVGNENIRKRFLSEGKSLFKMSHPNIIKVTDLIDQEDQVAIVMEYLDGETLKEYIERKGKLSEVELKSLVGQMLDALAYVHDQGLVHRDIKPSNFMLSKKGAIKLLDFGIAKNTDKSSSDYTQTGTLQSMGTPMYMSPEQVKSTKNVTGQSDIYSLGVVLWQMVMGQKPYDTTTTSTFELQTKIVNEPLSITNTKFDGIIQKATAKSLTSRYKNCFEIKDDLSLHSLSQGSTNKSNVLGDAGDQTIVDFNPMQVKEGSKSSAVGLPEESRSNATTIETKKGMKFYPFILALLPIVIILIISEISKRSIVTEEAYATVDTVSYTIDSFTPIDSVSEIMNAEPKN
jgi:serine/threonine protein kinase